VTAPKHHGATAKAAHGKAAGRHARAGRGGHGNSDQHANIVSHSHRTLPVNDVTVPGNDVSATHSQNGAHSNSGANHHGVAHRGAGLTDGSAPAAGQTHGRCAGNEGGGLGNGGPADGTVAHHPLSASGPAADVAGLEACD
jgi:hypothetical protein